MSSARALCIFLFVSPFLLSAQTYDTRLQQAVDLANKGDYTGSLEVSKVLYDLYPDRPGSYNWMAYNYLCLGNPEAASPFISAALQLDPTECATNINKAYYLALKGDIQGAKTYFLESIKLYPDWYKLNISLDEIRWVGSKNNQSALFNDLANYYEQTWKATKQRNPKISDLATATAKDIATNPENVKKVTHEYAAKFNALGWPDVAILAYVTSAKSLSDYGYLTTATEMAEAGYQLFLKKDFRNNYFVGVYLLYQLVNTYHESANDEKVVQHANELVAISEKVPVQYFELLALIKTANSYYRLLNNGANMKWSLEAYERAQKVGFSAVRALAADALSNAYGQRLMEGGGPKAVYYGEEAYRIATDGQATWLLPSIMANLSLRYISIKERGNYEKAIHTLDMLAAIEEKEKKYDAASATLNNIGAIYFVDKNFEVAAGYFEKSVSLAQNEIDQLNMSAKEKLTFYQSQVGAYDFLTACYANLNNAEGAFYSMERSRSRVLSERMAKGKSVAVPNLFDLKEMLQPDEACIMYDLMNGHQISILVVTKKHAQVIFHSDDNFIGTIKDKYLDRMNKEHRDRSGRENDKKVDGEQRVSSADFQKVTQLTRKFFESPGMADEVLTEYLKGYYRFLILPVANRLTTVKKLLISPNDVLNFIPFEALQSQDGKYLVEKYEVKYMHSASVMKQLRDRQYGDRSKPLLAMGGALFNKMKIDQPAISSQEDLNMLVLEVEENEKSNKSQRKAYAALFGQGPMNYLPGTVEEVKNISKIVPAADVYLGADMSENRIKAMAKNGDLGKYKILHLATHGFVVNEIPDLSGVAMSIFETEQGGEDGFLNVNEISALNLKTDLTILSACQTALGKIYSGEGVTGLTQSLLIAGSNGALVSLWPVSDTSTMLFMSDLYKQTAAGKPYSQVVNEIKRKFIKGEFGKENKHPNFWAPFVYFGN